MTLISILAFAAALFSLFLATVSVLRKKPSFAGWCFFAGMVVFGVQSLLAGLSLWTDELHEALRWLPAALIVKSFVPAAWLPFSLAYSRGGYREALARWKIPLVILVLLPIGLSLGFQEQLLELAVAGSADDVVELRLGWAAKALNVILLFASVWILMNLEQTFRSAVGTMRWRVKFVVLGLAVILGAHLYVLSQALVYSAHDPRWSGIESSGLLVGCVLLAAAYLRTGLGEIEVYPSRAVLRSSLTVLLAGSYLIIAGVLANVVRRFGGAESYQLEALAVLLGIAGLAVLLLSDRLRQRIHAFVDRHFTRAQHDSVRIWTEFSRRLANVKDQAGLCAVSARLVSETFEVLSVTIWLLGEPEEQLIAGASTAPQPGETTAGSPPAVASSDVVAGLRKRSSPFDLERVNEPWAEELRRLNPATFPNGGDRWCIPLGAGEQSLGVIVLADRVSGADYTVEQLQLLQCIADQVRSVLLNLRLTDEVARARELEAFRTMSAFFVHDLKNATASLNLMLKNLPAHLDDPEFRADAFRCVGNTTRRIDEMIGRLAALRQRPDFKPVEADLNQLVNETLETLDGMSHIELAKELQPLPMVLADREQIRSVVANLVLNALDALGTGGRIRLRTEQLGGRIVLSVTDNGCGMSAAFMRDSLFRPFQSTKKSGLGIGMFQARMIVEAHGGSIKVESEPGRGSTFQVILPVKEVE